ncbi:MAG: CNNM domain-containing protein, partial [Methylocella sp.]
MNGAGADALPVDVWLAIATIFLCVALSAFFSASETALTAASRARMHALEKNGDRRAVLVNRLLASRARLIGTMLLGNTLVNIGSSALMTSILVAVAGARGALYATGIMTVILLVFAEVMPKTVAINYPDRTSLLVARVTAFFVAVFGPVVIGLEVFVRGFLKVAGIDTSRRQSILS